MPKERPARRPVPPVNPYTPKQHLTQPPSESPPPSAQPLPPRSSASPAERAPESQDIPRSDRPAEPTRQHFDPWNSSSTGHQRAENRLVGSTSWRESRNAKLAAQFAGGAGGGVRLADTVGAGSVDFGHDGRKANGGWERGASGLRGKGQLAIWESMGAAATKRKAVDAGDCHRGQATRGKGTDETSFASDEGRAEVAEACTGEAAGKRHDNPEGSSVDVENAEEVLPTLKQIFRGLCFYINGSTAPTISDHKLKQLLAMHGASTSIALGRRTVTHVILGRSGDGGAGGGLAGGKLQKEIARVGGKGLRYVGVEWVVESVRAGKRLPEAGFSNLKIVSAGQRSVYGMFKRGECEDSEKA
ncbi:brca1 c terminus domain-containing protein [Diplodia corticola]|uniref:Brca1 c terminus domain-containing protein n=1 Tax=Diplodia corticola TaxID=236234 RepID=A0A1J9QRB4_9PEZI|nr:brca1 c terminus domain-containing protein [Diplodia corticola]OJD30554.1 brca1 c terminus domain-containing protein [Diplodia corticola]